MTGEVRQKKCNREDKAKGKGDKCKQRHEKGKGRGVSTDAGRMRRKIYNSQNQIRDTKEKWQRQVNGKRNTRDARGKKVGNCKWYPYKLTLEGETGASEKKQFV